MHAVDDVGRGAPTTGLVQVHKLVEVTVDRLPITSKGPCDTFSSNNEFFGEFSLQGSVVKAPFAVTLSSSGSRTFKIALTHAFSFAPPEVAVHLTLTEDDAGLEGADDQPGTWNESFTTASSARILQTPRRAWAGP